MRKAGGVKVQNGEDWGGWGASTGVARRGGFEYTWVHILTICCTVSERRIGFIFILVQYTW